ncbi:Arc family DNA-binding protein [Pseudomonas frederiksbergensis]|uniref:Arc family DNA-binding protein n=1 Tax=Pseudomonas frederiksbergensis TaxID=104087 RepID=UPI0018DE3183|nr:Arc family DNA-binding protein [Pseudomonas frederiksbergensis]
MQDKLRASPFPLRLADRVKEEVKGEASKNRRSLNAEIGLLIEEGLKWREMRSSRQVQA